jgi:methylthioribose-1-phosphate isomerase
MFKQPIPTLQRDGDAVRILDQTALPFRTETAVLRTLADAAHAIRSMQVRGAPLIGATAAYRRGPGAAPTKAVTTRPGEEQ